MMLSKLDFGQFREKPNRINSLAELGQWLVNVAGTMLRKLLIGLH